MVKKSKVYTRTGDKGNTALVGGLRISKSDLRIELYGEVDELNSQLGVVVSFLEEDIFNPLRSELLDIQSRLFDLGSNLACEKALREKFQLPQVTPSDTEQLEGQLDQLDSVLEPMMHFILPGGHKASAFLQVARTVCRRIERKLVAYNSEHPEEFPLEYQQYINRLSDYLFVAARWVNHMSSEPEIKWIPNEKT